MSRLLVFLIALLIQTRLSSQPQWPATNNTMKPWTRWWWQGSAVNKTDLLYNLQEYKNAGLGGVEITPIYGVVGEEKKFINYLSPAWMQMLSYTLEQSKKIGLGVDLATGTGWPFGGPWVSEKDASKSIYHSTYTLQKGEKLTEKIEFIRPGYIRTANNKIIKPGALAYPLQKNKNQQELSLDQVHFETHLPLVTLMAFSQGKTPIDLSAKVNKKGTLDWVAPAGKWTLIALFEGLHGKMVERAAPGGEGYAIDHFSATATRDYLRHFDTAFKGYDLGYLRSFFNDSYEVDDAKGQGNWTEDFLKEFRKRKRYDLKDHLPALLGLDSASNNVRVLYDYRSVIDELLLEHFTIEWKKWASSKSAMVRNQSHGSPANTLDLYSVVDIPETEGNDILRFKFATSAANVTGKKLVSAEAATWLNEHFLSNWADVKKIVDLFFLGGVNHIFYHGSAYSPQSAPWPGWLFYAAVHFQPANPMWKQFHVLNTYVTRIQSFLQNSKPDNDILLYYPIADQYAKPTGALLQHFDGMEKNFENTDFNTLSQWMVENDYSFDFFSSRQLAHFQFNKKIISAGNEYQVILLPGISYILPEELNKLITLSREGARVLVYRQMPDKVPGLADQKKNQHNLDSLLGKLSFKNDGNVSKAIIGKGMFLMGNDIGSLLRAAEVRKENLQLNGISFIRKINAEGSVYLINNSSGKSFRDWLSFTELTKAGSAAIFDPISGNTGMLQQKTNAEGAPQCLVSLEPGETVVVQIYKSKKKGSLFHYFERTGASVELNGNWALEFLEGGPNKPAPLHFVRPTNWTATTDTAANSFSGTGKYSITFEKPNDTARFWQLDLGKVHETAEVLLNGKSIASLIGPSFKVIIPARDLLKQNKLEIIVANLMANRISYMDRNKLPWRIFYNTNMPARKKENSKNGL
ncbi:MAG TPA: glycosyl hydrolase, partial [Flavitalea sp.]|nr:glycosyl hydrolase [Flavitalea sp.]